MTSHEEKIIGLIRPFHVSENVSSDTRIYHDLGLWGDDVWEIFEILHNDLNVDFSEFQNHFFPCEGEEGFGVGTLVKGWFGKIKNDKKWDPLTIGHLAEVAKQKKWFDPGPSS